MTRLFQTAALLLGLSVLTLRVVYAESIPLKSDGGSYVLPVTINGKITLDFTLDSGATDVTIPADVYRTLQRTGTISRLA
jgi:predicted aspartyl protease